MVLELTAHPMQGMLRENMFVSELCVLRTFGSADFSLVFICAQSVPEFLWDRLRASIQFPVMPESAQYARFRGECAVAAKSTVGDTIRDAAGGGRGAAVRAALAEGGTSAGDGGVLRPSWGAARVLGDGVVRRTQAAGEGAGGFRASVSEAWAYDAPGAGARPVATVPSTPPARQIAPHMTAQQP
eukprot:COSAG02_NODE_3833_length_6173_cov_11.264076_4_plen_185_part_00